MPDGEILQGMKAIIAYLRDKGHATERTTLWRAAERGEFPLKRRTHSSRKPRAYALKSEVDEWLVGKR